MADIPTVSLQNGNKIPVVGMGCWMGVPGEVERSYTLCSKAIKAGYRHFDTASGYGNERKVGEAIRDSGIPREEFFITTKLGNGDHGQVQQAFEKSLEELGCGYIDLYLIHWPQAIKPTGDSAWAGEVLQPEESPTFVETWKDMEKLLDTGKVKSIGVSNFSVKNLEILLPAAKIIPAINQVEAHPYLPNHKLKAYCDAKGIPLTVYCPLGQPRPDTPSSTKLLEDQDIKSIADRLQVDVSQVLISWAVQRGTIPVPKTENEKRMVTNKTLVKLTDEDMDILNNVHRKPGCHRALANGVHSDDGKAFGWTYEQLGWEGMTTGGIIS